MTAHAPLHLAFCDGGFDFDCPSCTALCCHGAGFAGSVMREVPRLMTLYPSLASLAIARQGDVVMFANPANGCFFLDDANLCRIEKDHGRSLKPGVCGLFPFNVMLRVGDTVMIRPHFLCPLRAILPLRPGEVEGTHERVAALAAESGLLGAALPPVALHASAGAVETLAREASFRDNTAQALGTAQFIEMLRNEAADARAFDAQVARAAALLGMDASVLDRPRDDIDDLLLLLASPLRTTMLGLSAAGMLVALALGALVTRRAIALGTKATLSAGWDLQAKMGPALRLLGRLDEPLVTPGGDRPAIPAFSDPALALAAAVALRAAPGTGTLTILERALPPDTGTMDRSILLGTLGNAIERRSP